MTALAPPRLAPSEARGREDASPVEIAGRVVAVAGREVMVADAFAAIPVTLAVEDATRQLAPGDLVVLRGALTAGALAAASVVRRREPVRPPAPSSPRPLGAPFEDLPASETERLAARGVGAGLAARAQALAAVRRFFEARGFLEVDTPAIVPSPGLDLHLDAFAVGRDLTAPRGYLITSPEYQMKRLLAGGVPRCFQVTRCFREGEVGRRHNPEFTMLEWYRAFAEVEALIDETEALVREVARALGRVRSLELFGHRVSLEAPFERLTVGEAFARYAGVPADEAIAMASADEDRFFRLLVDVVEPALARATMPVFLVEYPAPFASLARLKPGDARVAERFELYVAGVELCNGFGELTDPAEQRARLLRDQAAREALGKPVYPIDERFLAALEEGMPESAGNALGLDRLIAVCLGTEVIASVQAFPLDWL